MSTHLSQDPSRRPRNQLVHRLGIAVDAMRIAARSARSLGEEDLAEALDAMADDVHEVWRRELIESRARLRVITGRVPKEEE